MPEVASCSSLEEVRSNIDRIDRQIVELLAERGSYVKQVVQFKKTPGDVRAPKRAQQVMAKVKSLAAELGADASVTEQVYQTMIRSFVEAEMAALALRQGKSQGEY
jgi:isochorismate pyruvate lyase